MQQEVDSVFFLEQLLLRSCALRCGELEGSKKDCVKGCSLATTKPLQAATLAFNILGLEDQESHEHILSSLEKKRCLESTLLHKLWDTARLQ